MSRVDTNTAQEMTAHEKYTLSTALMGWSRSLARRITRVLLSKACFIFGRKQTEFVSVLKHLEDRARFYERVANPLQ